MKSVENDGRTLGILLLLQLAAALMLPFILLKPLTGAGTNVLRAAAENSFQLRASVLVSWIGAALTIGLGLKAFPVFRRYGQSAAILFLTVCAVSAVLDLVHGVSVMTMISLSQGYLDGAATPNPAHELTGAVLMAARRAAHVAQLLGIGAWIFVFYGTLLRYAAVPRPLAALGLAAIASQFVGVTLMMSLGYAPVGEMAMPMLPVQIAVAVWLIIKGLNDPLLTEASAEPGLA